MSQSPAISRRVWFSSALWAGALLLAAMIVVQLGKIGGAGSGAALAELPAAMMPAPEIVSRVGDYTVLTFNGGNDDILAVLDGRSEELYTYRVRNQTQFEFLGRDKLADLFLAARRVGGSTHK